jgi:hypothetical protein
MITLPGCRGIPEALPFFRIVGCSGVWQLAGEKLSPSKVNGWIRGVNFFPGNLFYSYKPRKLFVLFLFPWFFSLVLRVKIFNQQAELWIMNCKISSTG